MGSPRATTIEGGARMRHRSTNRSTPKTKQTTFSHTIPTQIWGPSHPGGTKVLWEGSKS